MTAHPHFCDCLDCLGGVPAEPTRVYADAGPGLFELALEQVPHGDEHKLDEALGDLLDSAPAVYLRAWNEQARAAGLSRRAWMRRVLNEAAGVR